MLNKRIVSGKNFKPITLVFDLVDMTKTCVQFLAIFVWTFQITMNLWIIATQMIVHHSISIIPIYKSFKTEDF